MLEEVVSDRQKEKKGQKVDLMSERGLAGRLPNQPSYYELYNWLQLAEKCWNEFGRREEENEV